MGYTKDSAATFTGASGQMLVMGELLHRKCNAAVPLVDVGTDVFAFRDDREEVARIQVKTASGKPGKKSGEYAADFRVPIRQLKRTDRPDLFYALAVRLGAQWGAVLVIGQAKLRELMNEGLGTEVENEKKGTQLKLYVQFCCNPATCSEGNDTTGAQLTASCGKFDLTPHLDAWDSLPPLRPIVPIEPIEPNVPTAI